jgi:hypothetical protein
MRKRLITYLHEGRKRMMTKKQMDYLRMLGYRDTDEDGALFTHPQIGLGFLVSETDSFENILKRHSYQIYLGTAQAIAKNILKGTIND